MVAPWQPTYGAHSIRPPPRFLANHKAPTASQVQVLTDFRALRDIIVLASLPSFPFHPTTSQLLGPTAQGSAHVSDRFFVLEGSQGTTVPASGGIPPPAEDTEKDFPD